MKRDKSDSGAAGLFRILALIAVLVGTVISEILTMRAGGRSQPVLMASFFIWILLPFVALAWANVVSKNWPALVQVTLYCTTLLVTLGSLAFYGGMILPPAGSPHAFVFVMGPLASWALMVIVVPLAGWISRRRTR